MKVYQKLEEEYLKHYFERVTKEESLTRPFVIVGEANGIIFFTRPKNVMHKDSYCEPYSEQSGFSWFAYDTQSKKRTWGQQIAFKSVPGRGEEAICNFDFDTILGIKLTPFDFELDFDLLRKREELSLNILNHDLFSEIATSID